MWIQIIKSLDLELELESQNGCKSDSGAGSMAGIVTPLVTPYDHQSHSSYISLFHPSSQWVGSVLRYNRIYVRENNLDNLFG